MKKRYVFPIFFLGLLISIISHSQDIDAPAIQKPPGKSNLGYLDLHVPVGVFARSHFGGMGLGYAWSHHRYGQGIKPSKVIGFTFNTGVDYFLGKNVEPAGYDFRYDGYWYFTALPGIICNPWHDFNFSFTAGPSLGVYAGSSDFGFGSNLFGTYYIDKRISIGPGVTYKNHKQTNDLWTLSVRGCYMF